jgi:hypothetical protein
VTSPSSGRGTLRRRRRKWAHSPLAPARLGAGERGGGAFPPGGFANARQWIEAAFGADINGDPDAWSWTDITGPDLVQWTPGVDIRIGYPPESAGLVPAEFSCRIRNDQPGGGDFTQGNPLGKYWPYIRENTPIRARIDIGNGPTTRFQGEVLNWAPTWDAAQRLAMVDVQAFGVGRRLKVTSGQKFSASRRAFNHADVQPVAYWSMEGGRGATVTYDIINNLPSSVGTFASVAAGESGGTQFGVAKLGDGSDDVANIAGGWNIDLTVPSDTVSTGAVTLQFAMNFGTSTRASAASKCGIRLNPTTNAKHVNFDVITGDNGVVALEWFEADNLFNLTAGPTNVFSTATSNIFDGQPRQYQLNLTASGGTNIAWVLYLNDEQIGSGTITPSFSGAMNAPPFRSASFSTAASTETVALGHVAIYNVSAPVDRYVPLTGHRGETATDRLVRLCAERGVQLELVGTSDMAMGPQGIGADYELMLECPAADGGILFDGLGPGLTYVARAAAYSRPAQLTLDASGGGDVLGPLVGKPTDQGRVNDFTATNPDGTERRFTRTDGDLGTDTVGAYPAGGRLSINSAEQLHQAAAWRVAQGTAPGTRYPSLEFELAKSATSVKAQQWLDTRPFDRIAALGVAIGTAEPDRSYLLRGWREKWNSKIWRIVATLTDYGPWAVLSLAQDTGDDDPFLGWLETDGSTLTATVLPTETFTDGFEAGIANWATQNSWTIEQDTVRVRTGTYALKLTPPGAVASGGAAAKSTGTPLPVTGGVAYLVEAWFYSAAGWSDCRAAVDWYDSGNVFISSSLGSATVVPAAEWTVSRQMFTAPAPAASARPRARQGGTPTAADVVWVDDYVFMPHTQLATPSGPVWTHDAISTYVDDIDGLHFNIDGLRVRVVAISGATSPQTLVVNPADLLRALPAGAAVSVWNPPVLGL